MAGAHLQHLRQAGARSLVAVDRAAVQRALEAGRLAEAAVELELQDVRQEVAHVGRVARHVILRARIEIFFRARHRRPDPLILQPQVPPGLVVIGGLDLPREDLPAPLIDQQAERQERDLLERAVHQQRDVA